MSKHLSLSERAMIHSMLEQSKSFKEMGRILGRSCSTISKEIRSHLLFQKKGCMGHAFNDCINRYDCTLSHLCSRPDCTRKYCRFCSQCHLHCHYYQKESCEKLEHPPYVCNGCGERNKCTLEKRIYSPVAAQKEYEAVRSESRSGISISEDEAVRLDELFSPLLLKGQSIHHVCTAKAADVMFSERTIYNYVDSGIFTAKNIDLPRKVKYRPRKSRHDSFKVDRTCRIGRTYEDFQQFLSETPDCPVVQLDSVEGRKGGSVLLTIHFVKCEFMLAFIREHNTAASVCDVFEKLYLELRPDVFMKLFPVLLADNGSEFSDPARIEADRQGNQTGNATVYLRRLKASADNFSLEEDTDFRQVLSLPEVYLYPSNQSKNTYTLAMCVSHGYLYALSYDRKSVYRILLQDTSQIRQITPDIDRFQTMDCGIYPHRDKGIWTEFCFQVTTATGGTETRRTRGIIYEDGECRYDAANYSTGSWSMSSFCGYVTEDLRMFSANYVYCDACQNYIGTICNLEEPITKTDTQSLKITYSITDG